MPYGRPSSVSKRTGPAESGAAVASRIALTASAISAGASGGSSGAGESGAKLEHAVAVGLAAEVLRHHRARLGPVAGELAVGHRAHPQSRRELELRRDGDADERRHGGVGAALAEERALELGVGAIERVVVPVESSARLGGGDEQAEQDGAEERLVLGRSRPGVGAREDRRSRLALQLLDRDQRIGPAAQARRPLLDERAHERAVLVQRRAARVLVLDEGHRQLGPVIELAEQEREGAEREAAKGKLELRSANGHASGYGAAARILSAGASVLRSPCRPRA